MRERFDPDCGGAEQRSARSIPPPKPKGSPSLGLHLFVRPFRQAPCIIARVAETRTQAVMTFSRLRFALVIPVLLAAASWQV